MTLLSAALPEFLGSLAAGFLLTAGHWGVRRLHRRRPGQQPFPEDGNRS